MTLPVSKLTSNEMLDAPADFHTHEIPNEIFAETGSFGHGNVVVNQSECFDDYTKHISKDDLALIDSVIADIDEDFNNFNNFSILKYIDPELDASLNRDVEQQKKLQEELTHLKQVNSELQDELNRIKAIQKESQLEILQKMDQQKQPHVDEASKVDEPRHEIDARVSIAEVNNSLPLSSSSLHRSRRREKPQRYQNESMHQVHSENNKENIVLQSATQNLRHFAKKTRRCSPRIRSQVSVHHENDGIKGDYHDVKYRELNSDISVNKSKKRNYQYNIKGNGISNKKDTMVRDKKANRYVCDVENCNSTFKASNSLEYHKLIHAGLKPYSCNECSKTFRSAAHLSGHKMIHIREKNYLCDVCNKSFRQQSHLSQHLKIHTGEKPYLCRVCKKSFRRKSDISEYLKIHTGEKPYLCRVCKKSFRRKSHLSEHLKIHTGEKPYLCRVCKKSFRRKSDLSEHLKIHTGEKPYLCRVCKKSFRRKSHLSEHLNIHTGEKPYLCRVCEKSFRQKSQLSAHSKTCAGKNQLKQQLFTCDYCGGNFSNKTYLKSHCLKCYKNSRVATLRSSSN